MSLAARTYWEPYMMVTGSRLDALWRARCDAPETEILYVIGAGFDPRMLGGIGRLVDLCGSRQVTVLLITFDEGEGSSSYEHADLAELNRHQLNTMIPSDHIRESHVDMWVGEGLQRRRIGPSRAAYLVDRDSLAEFSDVVLDVSSMPRGIYFPILTSLLQHTENMGRDAPNVFVHVCENAALDAAIREQYVDDDAYPVHGFGGHQLTDVSRLPAIWLPAIGSGKRIQLERAHEYVSPEEICPVLPAMSSNLRRADDIIDEYHDLLFDSWQVAHENIILAAERNPLENCRQLIRAGCSYADALRPLGGCRLIFSAFSSKMMSLGVLLAAYAFRYALQVHNAYLVNIEAQGYSIPPNLVQNGIASASEMHMIWLRGDCYADQQ